MPLPPVKAIKDQAALLGFEIGPDFNISLTALDTKSQIIAAKRFGVNLAGMEIRPCLSLLR